MAFQGKEVRRNKIVIDNEIIEQVSSFNYLGNIISNLGNEDIEQKLQKYNAANGIIRRQFGKQMLKETQIRLHNITAKQMLKFGSETWIIKQREKSRIQAAQMKFLRSILGFTRLDHKRNEEIRSILKVKNILEEIEEYREKWKGACAKNGKFLLSKSSIIVQTNREKRSRKTTNKMV